MELINYLLLVCPDVVSNIVDVDEELIMRYTDVGYAPVDGNVVLHMINDLDQHVVAFSRVEGRARELAVHRDYRLGRAQPSHVPHHHLHPRPTNY